MFFSKLSKFPCEAHYIHLDGILMGASVEQKDEKTKIETFFKNEVFYNILAKSNKIK